MKNLLCLLALLILVGNSYAQSTYTVTGVVTDAESGTPLEGARISQPDGDILDQTDGQGRFSIERSQTSSQFTVSFVGFKTRLIQTQPGKDQTVNVQLEVQPIPIGTTVITDERIQKVYPDETIFIYDYEFIGHDFYFILHDPETQKPRLVLMDEDENELAGTNEFDEPVSALFKDCLGNIHALSKHYAYQIDWINEEIVIQRDDLKNFRQVVEPCQGKLGDSYFYARKPSEHEIEYVYYQGDGEFQPLVHVMDSLAIITKWDEGRMGKKYASTAGVHRSAGASNFKAHLDALYLKYIQCPPVYAPLHILDDEIMVFDHPKAKLFKFDIEGSFLDSVPITYQHEKAWQPHILSDESGLRAFTRFGRLGNQRVQEIDLETGGLTGPVIQIPFEFIRNLRVKDNYLYFAYRDEVYDPIQRLYRLRIQ